METVKIGAYSGYRHNRYDGYNCTRGVLSALGVSGTCDAYADDDDYPDDEFDLLCENTKIDHNFVRIMLGNLDIGSDDLQTIRDLGDGETFETQEYWGNCYRIDVTFDGTDRTVTVKTDNGETFRFNYTV